GLSPPLVVADAGYGDTGEFRTGLTQRGINYIVQAAFTTSLHPVDAVFEVPPYAGHGRPRKPGYRTDPVQAKGMARSWPNGQFQEVTGRQGSTAQLRGRFAAARVRPGNRNLPRNPDGTAPE